MACAAAICVGCGDNGGPTGGGTSSGSSGGSTTGGELGIEWQHDCFAGASNLTELHPRLECTALEVPLDHDEPGGDTIVIAAVRVRTEAEVRRGQFWLLDGGPGNSGLALFFQSDLLQRIMDAGWDVVIPGHRGAFSPRLGCDAELANAFCRDMLVTQWGGGLRHFNTVQAAHDVAVLMDLNGDEMATVVFGTSYGTLWAQYLFALHPAGVDAAVLDSVLWSEGDVAGQATLVNDRVVALLQECIDDAVCGGRVAFGSGVEFANAVTTAFNDGDCGDADQGTWEETDLASRLGVIAAADGHRSYLPLVAALLARCEAETTEIAVDAIDSLHAAVTGARAIDASLFFSPELFAVVAHTTLLADGGPVPATPPDSLVEIGLPDTLAEQLDVWSDLPDVVTPPATATEVPVLIFNSRYDLATPLPWAEAAAERYGGFLRVVEDGAHGVTFLGNGGADINGVQCVTPMMLDFVAAPDQAPDDGCLGALPQLDVNLVSGARAATNLQVFGVDDPWSLVPAE